MRYLALLVALTSAASAQLDPSRAQAISDYACGETQQRPDLAGLDHAAMLSAIRERSWPAAEQRGEELSHSHTLANGHDATFYWYVPTSYDPTRATALAIFLHGGVSAPQPGRGRGQWRVWQEEADHQGWIVAAPSGNSQCLWWRPERPR